MKISLSMFLFNIKFILFQKLLSLHFIVLFGSWHCHWGEKLASFSATHPSWYHQWDTESPSKNAICCICIVSWYACCLWFSASWKLSLWWIIFSILLYLMVQWTCPPHIYWMIFFKFYILDFPLVLSSHWWLVNLCVRHASDLFQPLNQLLLHSCNFFGQIYFRMENWYFDWYISYFVARIQVTKLICMLMELSVTLMAMFLYVCIL